MYESLVEHPTDAGLDAAEVRAVVAALTAATGPAGCGVETDAQRVDLLTALEELKNAAAGLQVCVTATFDASQREQQVDVGESPSRAGRGVAAQIGLARRCSPHRGARHLSLARVLPTELPCTYAALRAGKTTEHAASLMAQGTACLSLEDRLAVDAQIAADPDRISRLGERGVQAEVAKAAARKDPASVVERRRRSEGERCVTLRPAPDTMTYLSALLPMAHGVAVYKALTDAAGAARAAGDERTRGQVMADALRDAVLTAGQPSNAGATAVTTAAAAATSNDLDRASLDRADLTGAPEGVGVVLNVIMTERQLFGSGSVSEGEALLTGLGAGEGVVDADLARQLAALTPSDRVWLRRLYTHPSTGELVAIDSRRRRFPPGLARLVRFRDQHCRTPWCGAPIRHVDHAIRATDAGPTNVSNAQGLCEACNYAKDAPGWHARPDDPDGLPGRHRIRTTTPTGHTYLTEPPAPPGDDPPGRRPGRLRALWSLPQGPMIEIVPAPGRDAA